MRRPSWSAPSRTPCVPRTHVHRGTGRCPLPSSHPGVRTGTTASRQRAGMDLLFLHRHNPMTAALWDYDRLGAMSMRLATPADLPAAHAIIESVEGPTRADSVHRWAAAQPGLLHVMESDGEVVGIG